MYIFLNKYYLNPLSNLKKKIKLSSFYGEIISQLDEERVCLLTAGFLYELVVGLDGWS